jgi:xylulokinase
MAEMGAPPKRLVAVGGGAKNPLWLQIVSDASGLPQDVPEKTIGASYGDAFLAGLATGIIPSLDNLRRDWVKPAATYRPRTREQAVYDRYYRVYRELYAATSGQMHELARLGAESQA